jgi:hypothetical protein
MKCGIPTDGALRESISPLSQFCTSLSVFAFFFRVLEMQAVLVALVENFEVSPPPSSLNLQIIRGSAPTLVPMVKGQEKRGAQMPLRITAIN